MLLLNNKLDKQTANRRRECIVLHLTDLRSTLVEIRHQSISLTTEESHTMTKRSYSAPKFLVVVQHRSVHDLN